MTVAVALGTRAQVQQPRRVTPVIDNHIGVLPAGPLEDAMGVVPIFLERFALVGKHGGSARGDRGCSVVLGRKYVARGPSNFRTQRLQRFDQHRGLDGHVQRAGHARTA